MNNTLRVPGASDKFFYYTASGHGITMDLKVRFSFKDSVDVNRLRAAAEKALTVFPEYAIRPVIKDGKIFYEENNNPVTIHDVTKRIDFATEQTNGYLFCIMTHDNDPHMVTLSIHHSVSDWVGIMRFLRTILANYAGVSTTADGARISAPAPEIWNTQENLDPYNVFANKDLLPSFTPDTADFFNVPEKIETYKPHDERSHFFKISLSVSEFLKKSRELHTSFTPLFISIADNVFNDLYDIGDKNFVMSLPVNLRAVFNTDCAANFSDAVLLPLSRKEMTLPLEEQCQILRNSTNIQKKPENYVRSLFNKAQAVRDFESDPRGVIAKSSELTQVFTPFASYVTTYLGVLDMPEGVNEMLNDMYVDAPFGVSHFLLQAFGDELSIILAQRFDEDTLVKALRDKLAGLGFDTAVTDRGIVTQNTLDVSLLKQVE